MVEAFVESSTFDDRKISSGGYQGLTYRLESESRSPESVIVRIVGS